jgi:glycosyltransferase involved in cell wall biosynthesis
MSPKVLFVGRNHYRLPLDASLAKKWDALSETMDLRVLASGTGSDPRFELVAPRSLDGPRFYGELPLRIARELRTYRPDAIVTQSPFEALAAELARKATRSRVKIILEVHGDWHTSTRLYGLRVRAALGPLGDRLAGIAVRGADSHRAVGEFTASLLRDEGRDADAIFTTYSDLGAFTGPLVPVPEEPRVVFVGVLERYKNVEGLAAAWRIVSKRVPEARLQMIGSGRQVEVAEALEREGVRWDRKLEPAAVAEAVDRARALLLPSASEGLPRVAIEAFMRGRAVVGSRAGGIPDIVHDEENGLLVPYGEAEALAGAIERVVRDHELAVRLGAGAAADSARWVSTPAEYASRMRALVDSALAG